jgi:RNA polymerase sigma-70 factor (ECF subfamily)
MFEQQALINEMDRLRSFAQRLTKNTPNADDLLQATVLRAIEKNEQFQTGSNLFGWASKIMFNIFAYGYRQKKRFDTQYDPSFYIDKLSVESSQEAHVDLVTVSVGLKRLSAEHREILMLVCVQGESYEEVAKLLRLPIGTIRSRLSRARHFLQCILHPVSAEVAAIPYLPAARERKVA